MKVLFGLSNDDTVKSIVKFYEETYKEKLEYKNVYYFKQAVQEVRSGGYDRVVILEDLEKYPTNNYAQIDDYIFKNIDSISDEFDAKHVIFVASDRRKLGDAFLAKLFNIGIYSVLTGSNRTKSKVCEAINSPKKKKDVKKYYEESLDKNVYSKVEVSEVEIQRILAYYRNQEGNTSKYVEIFDRICAQYTNEQMRIIIQFLEPAVREFLEVNSDKYKAISNMPSAVVPQVAQQQPIIEQKDKEKPEVIKIEKQPEIVEKIVVKQSNQPAPVITSVMEKEVVKSVYEVPKDYRKVVCLIGAPKAGTTFCINALAHMMYKNDVRTAIVDMTKKRDSYILYTYDNEGKRAIAAESLKYASNGMNEPLVYGKLSIYTSMPGEDRKQYNASRLIETVSHHSNVVFVDCDFSTPADYYRLAQEIYVVQDMDILNINQITMFLRELKSRGIPMSKVKIVINKHVRCALTSKDIIDGIATYTSPDLRMYDELFPASEMQYFILPFDQENYAKYVEMMYKYTNTLSTFSKEFRENLEILANSIYPLGITRSKGETYKKSKSSAFKNLFKSEKITMIGSENSGFEKVVK